MAALLLDGSGWWLLAYLVYAVGSALFVITDNREPKATLAWILLFWLVPGVGMLVYLFFGRAAKAFSRERKLLKLLVTEESQPNLRTLLDQQKQFLHEDTTLGLDARQCIELLNRNSYSFLTLHNDVTILQNATEKYPRLLSDLQNAQHSIHMQYFVWTSDEFTTQVKTVLMAKAKAGLQVRVLYDWGGSLGELKWKDVTDMRAAGVHIEAYLSPIPIQLHNIGYRNHRKIVVIDGDVGYVGGINLGHEHLTGGKHFARWRDTHLRIRGEATAALQATFAVGWFNTTQQKLNDPKLYAYSRDACCTPMQIVSSGPDSHWEAIRQLYFKLITTADKKVFIQSPVFIPDTSINEAIKAACLSGVDVRIMLTPRGGVYQVPYRATVTYCNELARAGAKIYFYEAGYFHAKTIMVDGAVCSIGSANMDIRSFGINYETNAMIYDAGLARELEQDFIEDMQHCQEFSWRDYQALPYLTRLRDSLYRLCSPLL